MSGVGGLLSAAMGYVKARKDLLALEGKTAGLHYGIIAGLFAAALVMLFFGYLLLVITLVFGIAYFIEDSHGWIWAMGGVGLAHVLGALTAVLIAKGRLKAGVFETTIEEFKKDTAWLHQLPKKP